MAATYGGGSYQSLGNGTYRVSGTAKRSAVTGRYVTSKSESASSNSSKSSRHDVERERRNQK